MDTGAPAADPIGLDLEVRHGVDWATYCRLRDDPTNDHVRMTYFDGTLVMSPQLVHDYGARQLFCVVIAVADAWDIPSRMIGTTTLRREGRAPLASAAKEADEGFYLGDAEASIRDNVDLDLAVDPPPSLAIEVDNTADSGLALRAYARIGVPELWIYKARDPSLRFLGLGSDGNSAEVGRSLGLPRLTPALVLEALAARTEGMGDLRWRRWLADWARALPEPPA